MYLNHICHTRESEYVLGGKPRLTNNQFIERLQKVKPDILPLESYPANNHTKIMVKCLACNYQWKATPQSLLQSTRNQSCNGCPKCGIKNRSQNAVKSNQQFVEELHEVNPNITPLELYTGSQNKILCQCSICQHRWSAAPDKLLSGRGCPKCANENRRKSKAFTREEFIARLNQANPDIVLLGAYVNANTKTTFQCNHCGHIWNTYPFPLLRGVGCPHCRKSKGEEKIYNYCVNHNINVRTQVTFDNCQYQRALRFDFYLPDLNYCIEYDGKQHFEAIDLFGGENGLRKTQARDQIKDQYCEEHNINLLRIPYTEYDNIDDILNKTIMHI